ncbi:MAG TPA: CDP-alcohol phosphatidyltransferase family protein [Thermoplasmata archaeon]|nr:CDP-alcohol phosphatidyltransferase family protein [Thermoplasmata archaeon]
MSRARLYANLATLANAAVGVGSVAYVLAGNKLWAMLLIASGIAFDGLDGVLSRRAGGPASTFGRYADSAADAITFGIAPAMLLAVHTDQPQAWAVFTPGIYVFAGLYAVCAFTRLVRFSTAGYRRSSFLGVPTPQAALSVILLVLFADVPGYLGTFPPLVLLGATAAAVMMLVPLPFPKIRRGAPLRRESIVTAVAIAAALVPLQLRLAPGSVAFLATEVAAGVAAAGVVAYYVAGPILLKKRGEDDR